MRARRLLRAAASRLESEAALDASTATTVASIGAGLGGAAATGGIVAIATSGATPTLAAVTGLGVALFAWLTYSASVISARRIRRERVARECRDLVEELEED